MISKKDARIFNIKIRIIKFIIEASKTLDYEFRKEELLSNDKLYFREKDLDLILEFMEQGQDGFKIKNKNKNEFDKILKTYKKFENENFEQLFQEFETRYKEEQELIKKRNYEQAWEFANNCKEIGYKLYWMKLPEFEEYLYINSGQFPTEKEFFNHIHILEDLYNNLRNTKHYSKKGDENLNKKIEFKIFTKRWGHDDFYSIERIKDGWRVYGFTIFETDKKASDLIKHILEHDSVIYPYNLETIFESLWKNADEEMDFNTLKSCINNLFAWISTIEYKTPKCIRNIL